MVRKVILSSLGILSRRLLRSYLKLKEPLHILILVRPFPDLRIGLRSGISLNMIIFVPEPFVFVEPPVKFILYMLANRKTYFKTLF